MGQSVLAPIIQQKIIQKGDFLINKKITSWIMHSASGKGCIENFYGEKISFSGCLFEGSPQSVFWSRYIEPFLENFTEQMIEYVSEEVDKNHLNIRDELDCLSENMKGMFVRVYDKMATAEQQMLGKGYPNTIRKQDTSANVATMNFFMNQQISVVLNKYKSKNSIWKKLGGQIKDKGLYALLWAIASSLLYKYRDVIWEGIETFISSIIVAL
jgi:hypothetical protein